MVGYRFLYFIVVLAIVVPTRAFSFRNQDPRSHHVVASPERSCGITVQTWRDHNNEFHDNVSLKAHRKRVREKGLQSWADYYTLEKLLGMTEGSEVPEAVVVFGGGERDFTFLCEYTNIPYLHAVEISRGQIKRLREKFEPWSKIAARRARRGMQVQHFFIHEENAADFTAGTGPPVTLALLTFTIILEMHPDEKERLFANMRTFPGLKRVAVDLLDGQLVPPDKVEISPEGVIEDRETSPGNVLRGHPIDPVTGEIDVPKLLKLFKDHHFVPDEDYLYDVRTQPVSQRRYLILRPE